MKLDELNNTPISYAKRALKENYELPFDVDKMSMTVTRTMLHKVRGLVQESKAAPTFYKNKLANHT